MTKNNILEILAKLHINPTGSYDNQFYVVSLEDSDDYSKVYTTLCDELINTEFPFFEKNSVNTTTKITNYFETEVNSVSYNVILIADFTQDKYYLKIGEK